MNEAFTTTRFMENARASLKSELDSKVSVMLTDIFCEIVGRSQLSWFYSNITTITELTINVIRGHNEAGANTFFSLLSQYYDETTARKLYDRIVRSPEIKVLVTKQTRTSGY